MPQIPWLQLCAGIAALLVGTSVYVFDRPAEAIPFFHTISLTAVTPSVFGPLGQYLPSFAHVFAFSTLTAALLGNTRRAAASACFAWCLVDTAFELGQHGFVGLQITEAISAVVAYKPILVQLDHYFLHGTFDPKDLVSIVVGAVAAYFASLRTSAAGSDHA